MIAEMLAALGAVKVAWESLEIVHMLHVGHIAGKAGYKGAGFINHAVGRQYQKFLDQKNPIQQLEREAKTLYDFQASGDADQAIQNIYDKAKAYLARLDGSIESLKNAKNYFLAIHKSLTKFIYTLTIDNSYQSPFHILQFENNFKSFITEFNKYLILIEPPPRQILYIAHSISELDMIEQYNERLIIIKNYLALVKKTEKSITDQFTQGFEAIHELLPAISSGSVPSFGELQKDIIQCMHSPEYISDKMYEILPNNVALATTCINILCIFSSFQKKYSIGLIDSTDQLVSLEDNPNWFPLLTEAEQIEAAQRIFLYAMNTKNQTEDEKLILAKIFLRQHVSEYVFDQIQVDLLAHEMARTLRDWQIEKCEQFIKFLQKIAQEEKLPEADLDGLVAWLKIGKFKQNSIMLFEKILVLPCYFSNCNLESALVKFRGLEFVENANKIIQTHLSSSWISIWEKNDNLIKLPKSFNTDILPKDRSFFGYPFPHGSVISFSILNLVRKLIPDVENLKEKLIEDKSKLGEKYKILSEKQDKASQLQKDKQHSNGVARVRKAHGYIDKSNSLNSNIASSLHQTGTINEVAKKRQVPTIEDWLQLVYLGLNPNTTCHWQPTPSSLSNYFNPDQTQQTNVIKAWLYACAECNLDIRAIYSRLSFSKDSRPLALKNTPEEKAVIKNKVSIQAILKNSTKISSIVNDSMVMKGADQKITQETETLIERLHDYYKIALTRVNPEYRRALSLMQQIECVIKNFFKVNKEIGEERFESVYIYLGDFYTVLSADDVNMLNNSFMSLQKHYSERCEIAQNKNRSALYTTMRKAFDGPLAYIQKHCPENHGLLIELDEEDNLKSEVKHLREIIDKMENQKTETELKNTKNLADQTAMYEAKLAQAKAESDAQRMQDKAEMDAKLKQSETERMQDKAELEAKRMQDKEESDANMKKILDLIQSQQPASAAASASNAETSESSFGGFFKFQ